MEIGWERFYRRIRIAVGAGFTGVELCCKASAHMTLFVVQNGTIGISYVGCICMSNMGHSLPNT